ncbi:TetR/AcrR family transcriptional regulator [Lacticaseibacillus hulanensis]|uniref:TetR/AcrR family transcriptional regulator n=1 Tax=Lacticaseibacillus hulanensis TaxID=2493111 RepID=UPI000FD86709|nr:TetR/AcrR family transcriptional regulator [Lacticaseibacillus hulanensis]
MTKSDDQRAKILDVARDLFAEKGFEGTTTRELNKTLGIADGLLYYYFPHGKQEILDTIVQQGLESRVSEITFDFSGVDNVDDLVDRIMHLFTKVWELFTREDNYQSFMITVRERMLLSDEESSWMKTILVAIQQEIHDAMLPLAAMIQRTDKDIPVLTNLVMDILQRHLYEALLISNQREMTATTKAEMRKELEFLLVK